MPRGQLTKHDMEIYLLKCKHDLHHEYVDHTTDPKGLANKYLNRVLDKMAEFAR